MFNEYSDMLSVDDASKALHIGKNSVYKLVNTNRLGCVRVGKKILIPKLCLVDFVQSARFKIVNCNGSLSDAF